MQIRLLAAILLIAFVAEGCGEDFMPGRKKVPYGGVEVYRRQLESKLLAQYKNHPEFGAKVSRVELEVGKDIDNDDTGKFRKVEFVQLVYDRWGERIPELEQEYFVVVFGPPGGPRKTRVPKLNVGLDSRGAYSEGADVPEAVDEDGAAENTQAAFCPVCGAKVKRPGICAKCIAKSAVGK